jgi:hypothetical protein
MIIEVFAMESAILRAEKIAAANLAAGQKLGDSSRHGAHLRRQGYVRH